MRRSTRWSTSATLILLFTVTTACLATEGHGGHEEALQRTAQGVFYEGHRLPIDPTIKTFLAGALMAMTIIGFFQHPGGIGDPRQEQQDRPGSALDPPDQRLCIRNTRDHHRSILHPHHRRVPAPG